MEAEIQTNELFTTENIRLAQLPDHNILADLKAQIAANEKGVQELRQAWSTTSGWMWCRPT